MNNNQMNFDDYLDETLDNYTQLKIQEDREKRKSPFKEFIQLNKNQLHNLIQLNMKSTLAFNILFFMVEHCNNYNCVIISQSSIAKIFDRSITSINLAIKILKEHNYIQIRKDGRGNIYMINSNITWKSYGSSHKFAEFNAKIIWSKEEIEKMGLQLDKVSVEYGQNMIGTKE